ncbi:nucleolar protein 12 [Pectinophora gossypiella]|uniref:nucleolar protein 12 n=1 Tax=Pectinophora gossypiella TaxID=13191 RepID=UPI00214F208A|nr:nucleolar protein 12 [Pectinophora gossypiella]
MGKRKNKNQERKKKVAVVFDEAKRKDFLCGFRKRKLERKKKAQEELQQMLKEEKRRIKQENKESYKKLIVSSRPIPDIEQLLQEEYEDEDVNVKIVELSADTLQKKDLVIGENRPRVAEDKPVVKKKKNNNLKEVIPGMGSDVESENEASEVDEDTDKDKLKTKKEIKRMLKHQATKKIQKSKVFQMKNKLERIKNKKKSQQKKGHMKAKSDPRKEKSKKKINVNNKHHGRRKH